MHVVQRVATARTGGVCEIIATDDYSGGVLVIFSEQPGSWLHPAEAVAFAAASVLLCALSLLLPVQYHLMPATCRLILGEAPDSSFGTLEESHAPFSRCDSDLDW